MLEVTILSFLFFLAINLVSNIHVIHLYKLSIIDKPLTSSFLILSMLFIAKIDESVKRKFSGFVYANCPLFLCSPELACLLTCELICEYVCAI